MASKKANFKIWSKQHRVWWFIVALMLLVVGTLVLIRGMVFLAENITGQAKVDQGLQPNQPLQIRGFDFSAIYQTGSWLSGVTQDQTGVKLSVVQGYMQRLMKLDKGEWQKVWEIPAAAELVQWIGTTTALYVMPSNGTLPTQLLGVKQGGGSEVLHSLGLGMRYVSVGVSWSEQAIYFVWQDSDEKYYLSVLQPNGIELKLAQLAAAHQLPRFINPAKFVMAQPDRETGMQVGSNLKCFEFKLDTKMLTPATCGDLWSEIVWVEPKLDLINNPLANLEFKNKLKFGGNNDWGEIESQIGEAIVWGDYYHGKIAYQQTSLVADGESVILGDSELIVRDIDLAQTPNTFASLPTSNITDFAHDGNGQVIIITTDSDSPLRFDVESNTWVAIKVDECNSDCKFKFLE